MTRAIAYLRVSTDRQGDSVELQAAKVAAYCAMRELDLVEVVEDAAVSGSVALAKRPAGRHLAEAMKRHGATNVVALKLDRLFRDAADALGQTKAWDRGGISLHLCDMGGSAVDTSSPMGRMMVTMLSGFAEFERVLKPGGTLFFAARGPSPTAGSWPTTGVRSTGRTRSASGSTRSPTSRR